MVLQKPARDCLASVSTKGLLYSEALDGSWFGPDEWEQLCKALVKRMQVTLRKQQGTLQALMLAWASAWADQGFSSIKHLRWVMSRA